MDSLIRERSSIHGSIRNANSIIRYSISRQKTSQPYSLPASQAMQTRDSLRNQGSILSGVNSSMKGVAGMI